MIRIAIVEDEKEYQECLEQYLENYAKECNEEFEVKVFDDGIDITDDYIPSWNIIFMDIKMKHMDGMKTAEKIRQYDATVIIIFITTMAQYAIKGYEVNALDFVLKPVSYLQFSLKLKKALNLLKKQEEKYLILPVEYGKERISTNDILFMEVRGHNLHIITKVQSYIIRYSMKEMEKELQAHQFVRCNHSYLINLKNVKGISKDAVLMGNDSLAISRGRKKEFLQALSDYHSAGYK